MLILLEGPDGAGKTSLAERIQELTGAKHLHKGPPERDVLSEYALDLQWYRPGRGEDVVCDRWHLGEEVYGPLLRGESRFTPATLAHVEKTLIVRGVLVGMLEAPPEVLRRRLRVRGDSLVTESMLEEICRRYGEVFRRTHLPRLGFRTDQTDTDLAADLLVRTARHLEKLCAPLGQFPTYVGDSNPRWLLLGDTRNRNRGEPKEEAAFTPGPGTSGRYLLEALPAGVREGCGLANAFEENVGELWEMLGHPRTVALGMISRRECQKSNITFGSVPHPQYVRRFHHAASAEYGRIIQQTLQDGEDRIGWRP